MKIRYSSMRQLLERLLWMALLVLPMAALAQTGPIAHWRLDEGAGTTTADASGSGSTGTLVNSPVWATGHIGSALTFNTNRYVTAGAPSNLTNLYTTGMTVTGWIKPASAGTGNGGRIVDKSNGGAGWSLKMNGAAVVQFSASEFATTDATRDSGSSITLNTWQHVAATWTGSATATTIHLYVNGVLSDGTATNGAGAARNDVASPLAIGNRPVDAARAFDGLIDEVRVYNRVLSLTEIQALADSTAPSAPSALSATPSSSTQINLSWTASTDNIAVTGYSVERCQGASCVNFLEVATPATASYSDSGLAAATSYAYRVRGRDAAPNWSTFSSTQSATTNSGAPPGPASATFTYDDLGRLRTGLYSDSRNVDYQYDPAGNRTTMSSGTPPTLVIGNAAAVTEGQSLSFPVTRTGLNAANLTVHCVTQNGTAIGGGTAPQDDFVVTDQTIVFLPGDPSPTTKNCTVVTKTDSYYEGTQSVTATLQNASAGSIITTGSAAGSILDATGAPNFTVTGSSSAEGAGVSFTIAKNGLTEQSHSVSYATANGTATTADADYTAVGPTAIAFAAAQASQNVSIATGGDSKYEAAETFTVALSSPTNGATLGGTSSATGTINNDDAVPDIRINDPAAVNEGGLITFTVQNVGNTNTALTHSISWATANGTATSGTDYTANSGTVSFSAGETSKTVQVQTLTDGAAEGGNETFIVNLSTNGSTNGATISDSQGTGTIADIDSSVPSTPIMSGGGTLTHNSSGTLNVSWSASTGSLDHYVLEELFNGTGPTVFNIPAGTVSKQFTGKSNGDYSYKVKACNSSNACSAYSLTHAFLVCLTGTSCD